MTVGRNQYNPTVLVDPDTGDFYKAGGAAPSGSATSANQTTQITAANSTNTKLDTAIADLASIDGHVDGLEALAAAGNTALADGTQSTKTLGPNGLFNATVKGYQQITSLSAATALTVPSGSKYCIIQCESQALRWRDDGTNPTASVGMRLLTTGELYYDGDLAAIKLIEETASAKANISYYA